MPRAPVFTEVMDVLRQRISAGEYMLRDLPGERTIAEEIGVSYMTARKAVLHLIDEQVLSRRSNGSLVVHPRLQSRIGSCQVALLIPAYPSVHLMRCRLELTRALDQHHIQQRTVEYTHWHDSAISRAVDGADGVIVIPMTEPVTPRLLRSFTAPGAKVVIFDGDLSEHGLPSVRLFAREHIHRLLRHLRSLGHRRIDCLNAQGHNDEVERRITNWRAFLDEHGLEGRLFDDPAPPYTDVVERAHRTMRELLRSGSEVGSALVCTTHPAALGAVRACYDAGVAIPGDVSVCAVNNEPTGRYSVPSITGLEMPAIAPLLGRCLDWFASPDAAWTGPLRIVPDAASLFEGESTGPAC